MRFLLISVFIFNFLNAQIYKVGFSQDTLENDWRVAQVKDVKNQVSKYPNLKLEVRNAHSKLAKQIADIEYFIENKFDFIITSPINAKITAKVLKKAISKGIKVILIDRGIDGEDFTTFIAPDNYLIAKQAGEYMAKKLKCKGTILMLEGIKDATPTLLRTKGFLDGIKKCKDINIIHKRANFLRADAIKVMSNLYDAKTKFNAIYSHSDSMLSGVRIANLKYDKNEKILNVGIDYIGESKDAILKGIQTASFTYDTCGKEGVDAIIDIISGKKIPKNQIIKSTMVTKNNALQVKPIF